MNAQQLKNSILQEAIEGRLVPQDPNDEPASVLLDKIRAEKKQLVKEGKLKKKDLEETPISENEIPFKIPESWAWCRLIDICIFLSRGKSPSYSVIPNEYPVFAQKCNLKDGGISLEQARFLNPETVSKWQKEYRLRTDDVLVNSTGTGTVCRTRLFHESYLGNYPFTVPDSHVSVVRTSESISSAFIFNLFNSKFYQDYWNDRLAGSTNQKELYIGVLQNTIIPLPPLAEQKRIVAKIEELLPKVEEYGKAQDTLNKLNEELPERLKKSILQEAIEGRLVPQDPNDEPASVLLDKIRAEKKQLVKEGKLKKKDLEEIPFSEDEIPFEIPESWEWVRIKSIFDVCSARRVHEKDWRTSGIPFYRAREIGKLADNGFVDNDLFIDQQLYDEFSKSGVPKGGDLMITAVGTLGKVYIVKEGEIFYYKDGSVLCMENNWGINPLYAKYVIESPVFINQYIGESQGTTVATLTMVRVNQYLFPLPPFAEQKRIVEKIEQLFSEIDKLKK